MRVLIQRVRQASVTVDGKTLGAIEQGLLVFVGIEKHDNPANLAKMADKLLAYRVFADIDGKMNLSVQAIDGGLLVISQFTLAADTQKGLRPSFSCAAPPAAAEGLFDEFVALLAARHAKLACGQFAADMQVSLINDGPVTFLLTT